MDNAALLDYRRKLIDRLEAAAGEFAAACRTVEDPLRPLESGGWSAHQLAVHVRDVDRHVYGMRMRRTAGENEPLFENFDPDAWMAEHYDPSEGLEAILDGFAASVRDLAGWLRSLPVETWARTARHAVYGQFTFQTWVERGLAHIEEHLKYLVDTRGQSS